MKNFKKIIPLILLFVSSSALAQIVNIPDANFKNELVGNVISNTTDFVYVPGSETQSFTVGASPVDTNGDGEIQVSEAEAVTVLEIVTTGVTSLQGIEAFTNLQVMFIFGHNISTLDLSNNLQLEVLICYDNNINNLILPNSLELKHIDCGNNNISSIDFSNNLNLEFVNCTNNNIVDLDFSLNTSLIKTQYVGNQQLETLNSKNGSNDLFVFAPSEIPNLLFACLDEEELAGFLSFSDTEYPLAHISSYCSFVPGGSYNTITGIGLFDLDNNGCDVNDTSFPFLKLNIDDGTNVVSTFTTNIGEYNFYTQDGTFTITPEFENPTFFNATPVDATINFPDTNNNITTQDFCITANGVNNDVEIVMAPTEPARPGFDAIYVITYKNKGNQTLSGDFSFTYDDSVLDYVSATETPATQATGQLTWDYIDLLPFENRSVYVTLNVNSPMEIPAINIDDQLDFSVLINPIAGDELPNDNVFDYKQIVVGSFDPNDITCIEGDIVEPTEIGEYLHYIINFENTGNFQAENIVVATEVDPVMFDINSLRVLSSSHDAYVKQTGNLIEIIFQSINLASGGHGNILLKVQTQNTVQTDDTVTKSAEIFFDYNFPIVTNDANTTFALLSTSEFEVDQSVSIYPNPVKHIVTISAKENIKSISLFDVQGRVLQTKMDSKQEVKLDMSNRANGVYFMKIITDKGIKVEKIIKD